MNTAVLKAVIKKWRRDAQDSEIEDGSPAAEVSSARAEGFRQGKKHAANELDMLIELLGHDED